MAADSVQVGKVDNCCEKCTNFFPGVSYRLANCLMSLKSSRCECVVLYLSEGPLLEPKVLSGNYPWIEAWETIIQTYLSRKFQTGSYNRQLLC